MQLCFSFSGVLVPFLVVISGLWLAQCWPMSTAMCLHCVYGCGRVVCLVVASFCIRILFRSLYVMFELVFVFS
jgi:hypothetical protein